MKNIENQNEHSNLVPFPNLGQLLVNKGMEAMDNQNYQLAVKLFGQAHEEDPVNPDVSMGLLVSLVELGRYDRARLICADLLEKNIGDHWKVLDIYLMVLLQLEDHQSIISIIKEILEEEHIPNEKIDNLKNLLNVSESVQETKESSDMTDIDSASIIEIIKDGSDQEKMTILSEMANRNVRPYMEAIKLFLIEENHPFLKTMLLSILVDQQIDEKIEYVKFGETFVINPVEMPGIEDTPFHIELKKLLSERLEHTNPVMYQQSMEMVKRHNALLYPLEMANLVIWADAYHRYIMDAYGYEGFKLNEEVSKTLEYINQLETISFPVI